jgi:hypothetical protein
MEDAKRSIWESLTFARVVVTGGKVRLGSSSYSVAEIIDVAVVPSRGMNWVGWIFAAAIVGVLTLPQLRTGEWWNAFGSFSLACLVKQNFSHTHNVQLRLEGGRVSVIDFGVLIERAENTKAAIERAIAAHRNREAAAMANAINVS